MDFIDVPGPEFFVREKKRLAYHHPSVDPVFLKNWHRPAFTKEVTGLYAHDVLLAYALRTFHESDLFENLVDKTNPEVDHEPVSYNGEIVDVSSLCGYDSYAGGTICSLHLFESFVPGCGKYLMNHLKERADFIELEAANLSDGFYETMGFTHTGARINYNPLYVWNKEV